MAAIKIVGAGHMGGAIANALCASGIHGVSLVDTNRSKLEAFSGEGATLATDLTRLGERDVVVLAIPPQAFAEFAAASPALHAHRGLILSAMAGLSVAHISQLLQTSQVVRSIPNTPSEVGWGMSVFFANPDLTESNLETCRSILNVIGEVLQVSREAMLDPATALCGGGPAFVAFFLDALVGYGIRAGFSNVDALQIALQVLRGTGELVSRSGKTPIQISQEVMTPQGTTERGIQHLESARFGELVHNALQASADRSKELNAISN